MKAFLSGVAACALISVGAWFVLTQQMDYSASAVNQSQNNSVRLD